MTTTTPPVPDVIPDDPQRPVRTWAVLFGCRFEHDQHPTPLPGGARVHPNGYVALRVRGSANDARLLTFALFGPFWSDMTELPSQDFPMHLFPLGCLATFDAPRGEWVAA